MTVFVPRRTRYSKPVPDWLVAIKCGMLLWWLPLVVITPFIRHWPDGTSWIGITVASGLLMAAICYWALKRWDDVKAPNGAEGVKPKES